MTETEQQAARILQVIERECGKPLDQIQLGNQLRRDLGLGGVGCVSLVCALADELGISISGVNEDAICSTSATVADVIAAVLRTLNLTRAGATPG